MDFFDSHGELYRRLFVPDLDQYTRNIPLSRLVVYNPAKQISQLQITTMRNPQPFRDEGTLVIHIDGACRNNGMPGARAAYGVYVGPNSCYNTSGLLHHSLPQTSTRAEIEALHHALDVVDRITQNYYTLSRIRIATDSSYLVNAISQWIEDWIKSGGYNSCGQMVKHFHRLLELHDRLEYMEYNNDGGLDIKFWHVPRERNTQADALAGAALAYA